MKKRFLVLALALALVLALTACGGNGGGSGSDGNKTVTVGATPAPHAAILEVAEKLMEAEGYNVLDRKSVV